MTSTRLAIWALAFRPLFLASGVSGAVLMAAWIAVYVGLLPSPRYFSTAATWHGHEMLFGFVAAVITGFLMTAAQNWTGIRGVHGARLQLLIVLWLAGRILPWLVGERSLGYAVFDMSFLLIAAAFLAPYLVRSKQRHNVGLLVLLVVLAVANLHVHLEAFGVGSGLARRGLLLGLDVVIVIVAVIGGRVVPAFTRNAVPEARVRSIPRLDNAAVAATIAFAVAELVSENASVTGALALVAAGLNGARLSLWSPWSTRGNPMLWILVSGYAWVVVGLALRGFGVFVPIAPSITLHALAVGAVGILVYGMMPRVSLGHTGRKIVASRPLVAGFCLINAAALARVGVAALAPGRYVEIVVTAGFLWIAAFLIFVCLFWRVLSMPRVDGRPG